MTRGGTSGSTAPASARSRRSGSGRVCPSHAREPSARTVGRVGVEPHRRDEFGRSGGGHRLAQRRGQVERAVVAQRRILLQAAHDHRLDGVRHARLPARRRQRRLAQVGAHGGPDVHVVERRLTAQAEVEHRAQPVDVRGRVGLAAAGDLGRGPLRCAHRPAVGGQRCAALGAGQLGQPEVEHLDELSLAAAQRGHEQVLRLDVAVHDAARVRLGQRLGRLPDQARRAHRLERPVLRDDGVQVAPVEQLHRVVPEPVVGGAVVEHAHGVRVPELGGGPHLALEAGDGRGVAARLRAQDLDRHVALERVVMRGPHLTHAAGADAPGQPVAAQRAGLKHLAAQRPHHVAADQGHRGGGEQEHVMEGEAGQRRPIAELRGHRLVEQRRDRQRDRVGRRDEADGQERALPAVRHDRRPADQDEQHAQHQRAHDAAELDAADRDERGQRQAGERVGPAHHLRARRAPPVHDHDADEQGEEPGRAQGQVQPQPPRMHEADHEPVNQPERRPRHHADRAGAAQPQHHGRVLVALDRASGLAQRSAEVIHAEHV